MCTEVVRVSHQKRKIIPCQIRYCVCGHSNHGHGPGGCSGETLRGAVWQGCKCETFRLSEKRERPPKTAERQRFGTHHQGASLS